MNHINVVVYFYVKDIYTYNKEKITNNGNIEGDMTMEISGAVNMVITKCGVYDDN